MPNTQIVNIKALGLNKNTNQLDVPPGSMSVASNVIIRRNGVVESRRGFKDYGTPLGSSLDRLKQLFLYKKRLFRHYNTTLEYDNGSGTFNTITGSFTETETGLRIKSLETNGNLYFTTQAGIQKLSVKDIDNAANTSVVKAGGVKAIDFNVRTDVTVGGVSGILPQDTVVAYRTLWGIKDINGNLIYGTPSPNTTVSIALEDLLVKDLQRLLLELDTLTSTSMILDGDYSTAIGDQISATTTGADLRSIIGSGTINLCKKLDEDIKYTSASLVISGAAISNGVCTITFSTGNPSDYLTAGDTVNLREFYYGGNLSGINGLQKLTEITSTEIKFLTSETNTPVVYTNAIIESGTFRSIFSTTDSGVEYVDPISNEQAVKLQTILQNIINELRKANTVTIAPVQTSDKNKISSVLTSTANVFIDISIPDEVITAYAANTYYFFQVYRTKLSVGQASGNIALSDYITAGAPGDECFLVYEAYPTNSEIQSQVVSLEDVTPDSLSTTPLYTNSQSGEGILQENTRPPFTKDIALYKGYTFYSNTRTEHKLKLNLISVDGLNTDYNAGRYPKFVISKEDNSHTEYSFKLGSASTRTIDFTGHTLSSTTTPSYVVIYPDNSFNSSNSTNPALDSNNLKKYVLWFDHNSGGATQPNIAADYTGQIVRYVKIRTYGKTAAQIVKLINDTMKEYYEDFDVTYNSSAETITIQNINFGISADDVFSSAWYASESFTSGTGEKITANDILLYPNIINSEATSKALAIDQTTRSIVRVINSNATDTVSAFYLSNIDTVPGIFSLENKDLNGAQFYVSIDTNSTTNSSGVDFSPDMSPELKINSMTILTNKINVSVVNGLGITASSFTAGDQIVVFNCNQSSMNGLRTITAVSGTGTTFDLTLNVAVTTTSTIGCIVRADQVEASSNEEKSNRIYYSKNLQPEAVPALNYIDVGLSDHAIKRIVPLRDTLFIFKEDGLYRLSGQVAPFVVSIFDTNVVLLAPDSIGITENAVYSWCQQGITTTSEAGSRVISRPIDFDILLLSSAQYTNFDKVTWGVGYPSDNSYIVFTNSSPSDTYATIGYRYGTLTQTWTTYDMTAICGVLGEDDKLYAGYGDHNSIMQERKTLDRTDYADREYSLLINNYQYTGTTQLLQSDISNVSVGDIIIQEQTVTLNRFNTLLQKLDIDSGVPSTDYYSTLKLSPGSDVRTGLLALTTKLDSDSLGYTDYNNLIIGLTSSFADQLTAFNLIINHLNLDTVVALSNYQTITQNTIQETSIVSIDKRNNILTLSDALEFIQGPITLYKAIPTEVVYSPVTMGDPMVTKQFSEASIMFENRAFSNCSISFSTDLFPGFSSVTLPGDGNGIFGMGKFGLNFFGGVRNSSPIRTYVPVNMQRCTYINVKYTHCVAREKYSLYGINLRARTVSTRAYWS